MSIVVRWRYTDTSGRVCRVQALPDRETGRARPGRAVQARGRTGLISTPGVVLRETQRIRRQTIEVGRRRSRYETAVGLDDLERHIRTGRGGRSGRNLRRDHDSLVP